LTALEHVLRCSGVPAIVTHKDPRAIVCSDYKRAKPEDFDAWLDEYSKPKKRYMQTAYDQYLKHLDDERVTMAPLEELAMNARPTMERMFDHVGKEFKLDYAIMRDVRFKNVRSNVVSADIVFEYQKIFTSEQEAKISQEFASFEKWFYE
jgi:hypothetical protein